MMKKVAAMMCALCLASSMICLAEETEKKADSPEVKAVYALFDVMKMKETYEKTIVNMLDIQVQQNPGIAPYRKVMETFLNKHMGWEGMKEDIALIYAKDFSVEEVNKISEFYKTAVGQKAAKLLPEYAAKGMALGQKRVQDNMPELYRMLEEERKKIEGAEPEGEAKEAVEAPEEKEEKEDVKEDAK